MEIGALCQHGWVTRALVARVGRPKRLRRSTAAALLVGLAPVALIAVGPWAAAAAAQPAPDPATADPSASAPVVAVLVDGLDWSRAPDQLGEWATASSAMRTRTSSMLDADAWMSISKGGRTVSLGWTRRVGTVVPTDEGFVAEDWDALLAVDRLSGYEGQPGTFGEALATLGSAWAFITDRAETAVIVADRQGVVPRGSIGGAAEVGEALASGVEVVVASTANPDTVPAFLAAAEGACVVVASTSSPQDRMHLGVMATSPECGLGVDGLRSASTRKDGYVAVIDIAPTVLSLADVTVPSTMIGRAVVPSEGTTLAGLVEADRVALATIDAGPSFVACFIWVNVAAAAWALYRRRLPHLLAAWLAAVPVGSFLISFVPWWDHGPWMAPLAAALFAAAVAGVGVGVAHLAAGGSRRVAIGVVAGITAGVLSLDAATGGVLQFNHPLGNSPINAGRFSGMGNVAFGFVLAGAVVAAGVALGRRGMRALPFVAVGAVLVVAADGLPSAGADVGGVLALVPAIGIVLTCFRTGGLPLRRLAVLVGAGGLLLGLFALYDLSQPEGGQTHLAAWLTGDDPLGAIRRKFEAMLNSFRYSRLRFFPVLPLLVLAREHRAWRAEPWLLATVMGLGAGAVVGTLVNDSGVAVLAAVVAVAWPALMGLVRHEQVPTPADVPDPAVSSTA